MRSATCFAVPGVFLALAGCSSVATTDDGAEGAASDLSACRADVRVGTPTRVLDELQIYQGAPLLAVSGNQAKVLWSYWDLGQQAQIMRLQGFDAKSLTSAAPARELGRSADRRGTWPNAGYPVSFEASGSGLAVLDQLPTCPGPGKFRDQLVVALDANGNELGRRSVRGMWSLIRKDDGLAAAGASERYYVSTSGPDDGGESCDYAASEGVATTGVTHGTRIANEPIVDVKIENAITAWDPVGRSYLLVTAASNGDQRLIRGSLVSEDGTRTTPIPFFATVSLPGQLQGFAQLSRFGVQATSDGFAIFWSTSSVDPARTGAHVALLDRQGRLKKEQTIAGVSSATLAVGEGYVAAITEKAGYEPEVGISVFTLAGARVGPDRVIGKRWDGNAGGNATARWAAGGFVVGWKNQNHSAQGGGYYLTRVDVCAAP